MASPSGGITTAGAGTSGGITSAGSQPLIATGAMKRRPEPPTSTVSAEVLHPADCTYPRPSPSGASSVSVLLQFISEGHDPRADAGLLGLAPEYEPDRWNHSEWLIAMSKDQDLKMRIRVVDLKIESECCGVNLWYSTSKALSATCLLYTSPSPRD